LVDGRTKLIHAVAPTAANVNDAACLPDLLHGEETKVWDDAVYQSQGEVDEVVQSNNTTKSRVRAKVEHPFRIIKRVFGFATTPYRGLETNAYRSFMTCALANSYLMRLRLLRMA